MRTLDVGSPAASSNAHVRRGTDTALESSIAGILQATLRLGFMPRQVVHVPIAMASFVPVPVAADHGQVFGRYKCDRAGDRIVMSFEVRWNEEAQAIPRANTATEVVYSTDDIVRCLDMDLDQKGLDENRKCEVQPIVKRCRLSGGTYNIVLDALGNDPRVAVSKDGRTLLFGVFDGRDIVQKRKGHRVAVSGRTGKSSVVLAECRN